ncbi:MAG: hypothetical protein O3A10_08485 [Chloroflexi bacterium]|nr:hypothetical protein [Chloroflexota bacterium]MDA1146550.1 hypothetical protein [Chloroflexota bacterium]MQC82760.1 hypothetical protein [Chloroflexota bacterium]PKB56752.1 MAG: hypothetical protein BZY69_00105 [SAR202 cluster bacterium Casp-Chloro-G1]
MGGDSDGTASPNGRAEEIGARRAVLIELLAELPETRLSKPTTRHGWTLRHELAWLAAADAELLQRLELTSGANNDEPHWRRVRGEAMHAAQEMRLAALREHLATSGGLVATSLTKHAARLNDPMIRAALETHRGHGDSATAALREMLAK